MYILILAYSSFDGTACHDDLSCLLSTRFSNFFGCALQWQCVCQLLWLMKTERLQIFVRFPAKLLCLSSRWLVEFAWIVQSLHCKILEGLINITDLKAQEKIIWFTKRTFKMKCFVCFPMLLSAWVDVNNFVMVGYSSALKVVYEFSSGYCGKSTPPANKQPWGWRKVR